MAISSQGVLENYCFCARTCCRNVFFVFVRTYSWNWKSCGNLLFFFLRAGRIQAVCVVSCWKLPRTHCYLQGFLHVPIFDFWKPSKYQCFFCVHQGKKGFGAITGNEEGETQGNISTRSKIETKTRNKCNFLHVAALWNRTARRYHSFSPQRWPKHCGPVSRQGSLPFHRVGLKVMVSLWGPETCLSFRTYFYGIVFKICGSFFFGEEVGKDCFKLLNDRGDQDCTWTLVSHKNVWTNKWPIRCRCHLTSMTTWSCLFYVSPVSTVIVSMSSCVGHVFVHLSGCIGHCQHYIDIIFAM